MKKIYTNYKKSFIVTLLYSFVFLTTLALLYDLYNLKRVDIVVDFFLIFISALLLYMVKKYNRVVLATTILFWSATFVILYFNYVYKFDNNVLYFIIIPIIGIITLPPIALIINLTLYYLIVFSFFIYSYYKMPDIPFLRDNHINLILVNGYLIVFAWLYHNTLEASNKILIKLNKQKELLLDELHHRVKNNLNLLISLLELEEHKSKEIESFAKAYKTRLKSIAVIHEMLFFNNSLDEINIKDYIERLTYNLIYNKRDIDIKIDSEEIFLDINIMTNIGLIINEWITNSLKYAFKEDEKFIKIKIFSYDKKILISYKDPSYKDISKYKKGFGLEIVDIAIKQLKGELKIVNGDYLLTFARE